MAVGFGLPLSTLKTHSVFSARQAAAHQQDLLLLLDPPDGGLRHAALLQPLLQRLALVGRLLAEDQVSVDEVSEVLD